MIAVCADADAGAAVAKLRALPEKLRARVAAAVVRDTGELWNVVRGDLPGRLRDGIEQDVRISPEGASGRVFSESPYVRIREYGGRIAVPEIVPVKAKALVLPFRGKPVFAAHVRAHIVEIPARPSLRSAIEEIAPVFRADLGAAVAETLS